MGNSNQAVNNIRTMITNKDRTYAWLSRAAGVPYKRILAEVKNGSRPLSLETAIDISRALEVELPDILGSEK